MTDSTVIAPIEGAGPFVLANEYGKIESELPGDANLLQNCPVWVGNVVVPFAGCIASSCVNVTKRHLRKHRGDQRTA